MLPRRLCKLSVKKRTSLCLRVCGLDRWTDQFEQQPPPPLYQTPRSYCRRFSGSRSTV